MNAVLARVVVGVLSLVCLPACLSRKSLLASLLAMRSGHELVRSRCVGSALHLHKSYRSALEQQLPNKAPSVRLPFPPPM
eukprot:scaffold3659_cov216-Alexandrium_tamarense.AAC.7